MKITRYIINIWLMVIVILMTFMSFDSFEGVSFIEGFIGFIIHNLPNLAILLSIFLIKNHKLKGYTQILIGIVLFFLYGGYRLNSDQWAIYIIVFTVITSGILYIISDTMLNNNKDRA